MIVIGVAPGLKSLTYSVTEIHGSRPAVVLDKDVLLGPRVQAAESGPGFIAALVDLGKKAYVHRLVLDVVFERALVPIGRAARPGAILAIGPPCNPKEIPAHVHAVRVMLSSLAAQFAVPVLHLDEPKMQELLAPKPRESWFRVANARLNEPLDTDDRKIVLAVAIALAGDLLYQERPVG